MHDIIDSMTLQLVHKFGPNIIRRSNMILLCGPSIIRHSMFSMDNQRDITTAIEIGTCTGTTSAYMSRFCKKLITIDIPNGQLQEMGYDADTPHKVWEHLGIKNIEYKIMSNDERIDYLRSIDYEFVFLDHDAAAWLKKDWTEIKKSGRVLFHDYGDRRPELKAIVDSLPEREKLFYNTLLPFNHNQKIINDTFVLWDRRTIDTCENAFRTKLETGRVIGGGAQSALTCKWNNEKYTLDKVERL